MKAFFKILLSRISAFKAALIIAASFLGVSATISNGTPAQAQELHPRHPGLQMMADKMAKQMAPYWHPRISTSQQQMFLSQTLMTNGVRQPLIIAALFNTLGFTGDTLKAAINTASLASNNTAYDIAEAVVTDTFLTKGADAAYAQREYLADMLDYSPVSHVTNSGVFSRIEPAAGETPYDG